MNMLTDMPDSVTASAVATCGVGFALLLVVGYNDRLSDLAQRASNWMSGSSSDSPATTSTSTAQSDGEYVEAVHDELDFYTKSMLSLIRKGNLKHNASAPKGRDIPAPSITDAESEFVAQYGAELASNDEDVADSMGKMVQKILRDVLNWRVVGMHESNVDFRSMAAGSAFKERYLGDVMPAKNSKWTELTSDAALSRLAFSGMWCQHTRRLAESELESDESVPEGAVFVSDCSALSAFAVKTGYERYGATAYFDAELRAIGIFWSHSARLALPNSESAEWAHAKFVWRSSWLLLSTLRDHLYETHILCSNLLATATIEELAPSHPLRAFVKPFTFRTVTINHTAVQSLTGERGLVHRIWGFEYAQIIELLDFAKANFAFKTLPEMVDESMRDVDDSVFGFREDATAFWTVMREYVAEFLRIRYGDDAAAILRDAEVFAFAQRIAKKLKLRAFEQSASSREAERFIDVLTQLLCTVSGVHEHVGTVSDYVASPDWVGTRLRPKCEAASVQEYALVLVLVCATGLRMPRLMDEWTHLIPDDAHHQKVLALDKKWRAQLETLATRVELRNAKRVYPTNSFNPRNMECSVSV
jgi:hypothetical protein